MTKEELSRELKVSTDEITKHFSRLQKKMKRIGVTILRREGGYGYLRSDMSEAKW
jgi:biotin operon repressor